MPSTTTVTEVNTTAKRSSSKKDSKKREIQHNYHDHANDDGKVYMETPLVSKGGVTVPFPMKLHNMLEHIAQNEPELSHIVSWQPHGRCFLVHNIKEFADDVLPRFFQQRKYASFQRQLNLYGFSRLTKGPDRGAYYHELFLRSKSILCRGIYRMKVKGTGSRMASNPDQEPNFYQMASMPPAIAMGQDGDMNSSSQQQQQAMRSQGPLPPPPLHNGHYSRPNNNSSFNQHQQQHLPPMPPQSAYNDNLKDNSEIDQTNFVFDNMPFHALSNVSRRHSLMLERRLSASLRGSFRNSFRNTQRLSSIVVSGNDFDREMEMIAQLGDEDLTDNAMGDILDKIIDHRVSL